MTKLSGRPNVEEIRRVAIQIIKELQEVRKCQ
jgi:hypothetical protein